MARRVLIAGVQRRDQCSRKLEVRALECLVRFEKISGEPALVLIETVESFDGQCWHEEEHQRPGRNLDVDQGKQRDHRCVGGRSEYEQWRYRLGRIPNRSATHGCSCDCEDDLKRFAYECAY